MTDCHPRESGELVKVEDTTEPVRIGVEFNDGINQMKFQAKRQVRRVVVSF